MNVALIYPPAFLKRWGQRTQYHLILPHLCHQKRYQDFYLARSKESDYVILDNGAAEDVTFGPKHLLTLADLVEADEIVVPDTLFDAEETIAKAMAFSRYAIPELEQSGKPVKYMGVLQGTNLQEVMKCLVAFTEMPALSYITTIGIPRLLVRNEETDKYIRVSIAEYVESQNLHLSYEFHALGSTPYLQEVKMLSMYKSIRGIDTSVPVSMGLNGLDIRETTARRHENYFDLSRGNIQMTERNIETYLAWADYHYERPRLP